MGPLLYPGRYGAGIAAIFWYAGALAAAPATAYVWDSVAIGGGGFVSAVIPSRSEAGVSFTQKSP